MHRSLRSRVRPELYESWLSDVDLIERDGPRFVFRAPSPFIRDWVRRNFLSELQSCLESVVGRRDVHVVLRSGSQPVGDSPLGVVDVAAVDGASGAARLAAARVAPLADGLRTGSVPGGPVDDLAAEEFGPDGFESLPAHDDAVWIERGSANEGRDPLSVPGGEGEFHGEAAGSGAAFGSGAARERTGRQVAGGPLGGAELNRNYTFETFVVGPCNRLSHAAALAVGDNPGRAYNPFFVHGNVGLGKTHVLQAVCHSIRRRNEDATVLYLSCEDFTNRFIHAIQRGELDKFREIHRGVDVLVIDDIQFLENKEKTQDEFFHTFNALYNTNRQIILSSDRPPSEIPTIEERLVSRFKWGLVAEMELPCFETRVAIVKRKARLRQVEMPDEVAWFIAERIDTNIRELEGAVIKVVGIASITERPLSVELAEEALRGVVVSRARKLSLGDVMGVVTGHFSVSARELTGKGRTQAVSLPRQICMYLCRQHTEQSLEEIGRFFGNRDHTTVIYAVQKIKKRVKEDRVFRELVGTLSSRLSG